MICCDQAITSNKLLLVLTFPSIENVLIGREESLDLVIILPEVFINTRISKLLSKMIKTEEENRLKTESLVEIRYEKFSNEAEIGEVPPKKKVIKYRCPRNA